MYLIEKNNVRIGFNTLYLIPNKVGGTEYYLRSIVKYMGKVDTNNQYTIFCNQENRHTFKDLPDNFTLVNCGVRAENRLVRLIYEQLVLPFVVASYSCDTLHSTGYFGPLLGPFKKVVTVHDANWKDHPRDVSFIQRLVLSTIISLSVFYCDAVVTDSEFSKSRLLHYFPLLHRKLFVISPGVDDDFFKELDKVKKSPFSKRYILSVGAFYPHKRVPQLIRWWNKYFSENDRLQLVLVGQNGLDEIKVKNLLEHSQGIVHFTKVPYNKLAQLYKYASACVFPSMYEGFGYPVYEALSAGASVYVAKPKMYLQSVNRFLHHLNFGTMTPMSLLQKRKRQAPLAIRQKLSYEDCATQLLKLYRSLKQS